jgi:hypothetical protein
MTTGTETQQGIIVAELRIIERTSPVGQCLTRPARAIVECDADAAAHLPGVEWMSKPGDPRFGLAPKQVRVHLCGADLPTAHAIMALGC